MSDHAEGATSDLPGSGKLYDAQGQVIQGRSRNPRGGAGPVTEFIRDQPISAVLHAFALGYILGKIV